MADTLPPVPPITTAESEAPTPVAGTPTRPKKLSDSDELEAQAHLLEARTALIQAKWSFWDRLIMRGVIPFAMLIGGPVTGYYFHTRAETSDANQGRMEQLIKSNEALGRRLEQILVVTAARKEVATFGKDVITSEIAASDHPDFAAIRARVENALVARVTAQLGADPVLIKQAVTGAVDEVAPQFERSIKERGGRIEVPDAPRFQPKK